MPIKDYNDGTKTPQNEYVNRPTPLEALKYLKENKRRHWLDNDNSSECLDIIETALKRLEELEKITCKKPKRCG